MPSHQCRIPDSGDAPNRMRPLPFHHQRSPSSSLVNIPQDTTTPEPSSLMCSPLQATKSSCDNARNIRSRRHARHVDIRDPPHGAIDFPVLRLHGRALGVSDRPAPREPMTKPSLSRDFRLSDSIVLSIHLFTLYTSPPGRSHERPESRLRRAAFRLRVRGRAPHPRRCACHVSVSGASRLVLS